MKATLEFNLPDDQDQFELATNALKWMSFVHEYAEYLRTEYKYNEHKYTDEQYKVLEQVREKFYEMLDEGGLSL